jgi:predicted transcriptional regulator
MITRENFEKGNFKTVNSDKEKHPVLLFLKKNRKNAYTIKEIVKHTKMKEQTVRSIIRKLIKENKVIHKIPYFIAKN